MTIDNRVVVITGASGGIGLAAARLFVEKGSKVYGLSRKPYDSGKVTFIPCDISDEKSVKTAFGEIYSREGRIDLLINNAGFGISGAVEFTDMADAKRQFDVNFFGMLACANAALPRMRIDGGMIINVSSVAGITPIPYQALYSASKAAINSVTRALACEVHPFPVNVTALMPGDIKTGFTAARKKELRGGDIYKRMERSISRMERDERNGMPPESIAKRLYSISKKKKPKPLYSCGLFYKLVCSIEGLLPVRFVTWALRILYS